MPQADHESRSGIGPTKIAAVFVLALLPYFLLAGKPLYNDALLAVANNPTIAEGPLSKIFVSDFWGLPFDSEDSTGSYRPAVSLTYALQARVFGSGPALFHLVDMALHGLAAVLVLLLIARLVPGTPWALPAAALFAVHPVLSDAVCSVTGRSDMMAAAAMIGALLLHLKAPEARRPLVCEAGAVLLALLAMMSKEYGVAAPFLLVVAGYATGKSPRRLYTWIAAFVVLAAYLLLRANLLGQVTGITIVGPGDHPLYDASLIERVATAASLLVGGVRLILLPFGLSYLYGVGTWAPASGLLDPWALLGFALVAVAGLLAWRQWKGGQVVPALAAALFLLPLAPVLNVVALIPVYFAERFLYAPVAAVALLLAWGLGRIRAPVAARVGRVAVWAVVVVFAGTTMLRVDDWASTESLARKTLERYPEAINAWFELGHNLAVQQRPEEAAEALAESVRLEGRRPRVWMTYAQVLGQLGRHDESADAWRRVVDLSGGDGEGRFLLALGEAELLAGRPAEAVEVIERVRAQAPNDPRVASLLGRALLRSAQLELAAGRLEQARAQTRRAIELEGMPAEAWFLAGLLMKRSGAPDEALPLFQRAVSMDPGLLRKKFDLAEDLQQAGRYGEAASIFREILDVEPNHVPTLFRLGRLLTGSDKPELAVPYLERGLAIAEDETARALLEEARRRSAEKASAP